MSCSNALSQSPVLIVEDEPLSARRLQSLLGGLGCENVLLAGSLAQGRACLRDLPVGLALVDLGLPDGSGIDLIAEMRDADSELGILVISSFATDELILAELRAGATGYLLKERDDFEMALSIRSALRGGAPIDPFIARRIIAELQPAEPDPPRACDEGFLLSTREQQVLHLVADGLTNQEIAEHLHLSRHTVESHIKKTYRKLAVSSRTRAVSRARGLGLLD